MYRPYRGEQDAPLRDELLRQPRQPEAEEVIDLRGEDGHGDTSGKA